MPQPDGLTQTKWADHLRGCAEVANDIAKILNIHEDGARQAMFATVAIDAKNHGVFLEPVPKDSKTPVIQPETAAASNATEEVEAQKHDEAAAAKADAQVKDVPKTTTPEMDEGARRTSFLTGIESARILLNKLGHKPEITPAGLNVFIRKQFKLPEAANLGSLDIDQLEKLMMLMSEKVNVQREKANASEKSKTSSDTLEDWP